jgi:hypothetical protein
MPKQNAPQEVSRKTEQHLLSTLLRSAQMSSRVTSSWDSFAISLEKIREYCGVERSELLQPFSAEAAVTHGGFMMRYEPEYDRVHFTRITSHGSAAPTAPLAPVAAPVPTVAVETPQQPVASMTAEQVTAIAKHEFASDENLRSEFTNEARYVAWRKAEVGGRVRIFGRPTVR